MTVVIFAVVALAVLGLLVLVHRWLWIRLVRDTTRPGGAWRRAGTALAFALPALAVAALTAGRAGAPFWLQRAVSWPGFMWLAVLLYLTLAMLVAEPARALLLRRPPRQPPEPTLPAAPAPAAAAAAPTELGGATPGVPAGAEAAPAASRGAAPGPAPQSPAGLGSAAAAVPAGAGLGGAAPAVPGGAGSGGAAPAVPGFDGAASAGLPGLGARSDAVAGAGAEPQVREGAGRGTAPQAPTDTPVGGDAEAAAPAPAHDSAVATGAGDGMSRRRFVARVVGGAAVAAAAGTVGYGTYGVLRGPRVKRVTVPLAKLPRAAHGFRIAVVSDVHLGPILGRAHTARIVDTVNRTQPDLIAIVGDLVDGNVHDLGPAAEPLRGLRARHGSYFVTGNHEYFSGAQQWIDHVRELGLTPLENARRPLPLFDLAGVNDVQGESEGHGPDFEAALGDRDRSRAAVLLAHQPIVIHDAVRHGVDLQLSGHTHGGQLWPGNYLAELANPTVAGLERYGDTQLYVSRGAGAWGPPVRVGAPSDITVVELASYQA
ncbi:putative metallophosphoesterase [Streptomyces sp. ADI91-18]|uniref:metallophosphoesterase n=1 Tax=Streptomyces sp. ADI91-18 TaxID=1522755 RepID=UPI000F5595B3|nr:metallophosphoesterase [Streptomyces sp. ADI91-18]RPK46833.1 putative metallophosphoesterase [Streptomyces sp. ADI91-18]